MTQNIMPSAVEASGPKKYFFAFSILLDGLAHISAIFLLKILKISKIGSPYCRVYSLQSTVDLSAFRATADRTASGYLAKHTSSQFYSFQAMHLFLYHRDRRYTYCTVQYQADVL
jgi:hypothetical protein